MQAQSVWCEEQILRDVPACDVHQDITCHHLHEGGPPPHPTWAGEARALHGADASHRLVDGEGESGRRRHGLWWNGKEERYRLGLQFFSIAKTYLMKLHHHLLSTASCKCIITFTYFSHPFSKQLTQISKKESKLYWINKHLFTANRNYLDDSESQMHLNAPCTTPQSVINAYPSIKDYASVLLFASTAQRRQRHIQ